MEQRQGVEDALPIGEIEAGERLPDIGQDVVVAQLDPLGHPFRTRREKNHRRGRAPVSFGNQSSPRTTGLTGQRCQFGHSTDLFSNVLQVHQIHTCPGKGAHVQTGLFNKAA